MDLTSPRGVEPSLPLRLVIACATTVLLSAVLVIGTASAAADAELDEPISQPDTTDAQNTLAIITSQARDASDSCDEPDIVALELLDLDTNETTIVATNGADCSAAPSHVRHSPDRSLLSYQGAGSSTSILDIESAQVVRSVHDCDRAEWNPDGSLLACGELSGSVKVIVVETGSNVNSLSLRDSEPIDAFAWVGPTELVVASAEAGSACAIPAHLGPRRTSLWRLEIAEPVIERISDSPCDVPVDQIQASEVADRLLFTSRGDIYVTDGSGSNPARVVLDDGHVYQHVVAATWTTDDQAILAVTERSNPSSGSDVFTRLEQIDPATGARLVLATLDRNIIGIGNAASVAVPEAPIVPDADPIDDDEPLDQPVDQASSTTTTTTETAPHEDPPDTPVNIQDTDTTTTAATTSEPNGTSVGIRATTSDPVVVTVLGDDPDDQTPPELTFTGIKAGYGANETLNIKCKVSDADSGIDTSTCDSMTGKAYLFRGSNVVVGTATDLAGNSTTVTQTIDVEISTADLIIVLRQIVADTPELDAALSPLVDQLAGGDCGSSFRDFGAKARELGDDGSITAASAIQIYSLGIAVCRT